MWRLTVYPGTAATKSEWTMGQLLVSSSSILLASHIDCGSEGIECGISRASLGN